MNLFASNIAVINRTVKKKENKFLKSIKKLCSDIDFHTDVCASFI